MTVIMFSGRDAYLFNQFKRGCEGKTAFRAKMLAENARDSRIAKLKPSVRKRLEGTEAYQCQFCGNWHLGHSR